MQREEFERIASTGVQEWMHKMDKAAPGTTINRMALAALTASSAVLGRPAKPRTRSDMIEQLRQHNDSLTCLKSEQQIMEGRNDDEHTGLIARSGQALRLATLFNDYVVAGGSHAELQAYLAGEFASTFFYFAQKECARQGHGIEGLIRAVGIVIGEVSLEEVVFG